MYMIHINLNMIFYSPTKTIYIKYYLKNIKIKKWLQGHTNYTVRESALKVDPGVRNSLPHRCFDRHCIILTHWGDLILIAGLLLLSCLFFFFFFFFFYMRVDTAISRNGMNKNYVFCISVSVV